MDQAVDVFAGELTLEWMRLLFETVANRTKCCNPYVTDMMGNTATCTAIITVLDNHPRSFVVPPNMNAIVRPD